MVDALYDAGKAVLALFPKALATQVRDLRGCRSEAEFRERRAALIDATIALTEPWTPDNPDDAHQSIACPLCGGEFVAPAQALRNHLTGSQGPPSCRPMRTAIRFLWDCVYEHAAHHAALETAERRARRAAGPVYRFELDRPPQLFDEGLLVVGETRRSETELPAIEAELATLGFRRVAEGVEVRYELVRPDAYVLADPRLEGRITFTVYLPEAREQSPELQGRHAAASSLVSRRVYLLDHWTENRAGKLDAWIQTAVWQMTPDEG